MDLKKLYKQHADVILSFALLLLIAMAVAVNLGTDKTNDIPREVKTQFDLVSDEYHQSFGATLDECSSNGDTIYVVEGSGGYSGVSYYYDASGTELGQYNWDDIIDPDEPEQPVDLTNYSCLTILESK